MPKMVRCRWQIIVSFALWFGIIFAGCYNSRNIGKSNPTKSSAQTEPERDPEKKAESKEPTVGKQGIYSTWESLRIEMQPDSAVLCPGECIDISVRVFGGNPPYRFSWDHELSSVTTRGPHEVCPDANTLYTVSVRDTDLDTQEFAVPSEQLQGSTRIKLVDDCASSNLLDAGDDANAEDASEHSEADASDVEDASDDSTNDSGESATDAPCVPNCPDLDWVTIEGGTFMMGSSEGTGDDYEHPRHEVTVRSFKMSKTEITVAQYRLCVDANVCIEPDIDFEPFNWGSGRENHPVDGVSWYQAREFAQWLGGRLPSEAQWEYAARSGGRDVVYPWGNAEASCESAVIDSDEIGNLCGNDMTMEVCSKPLGNTIQGLCDMGGNVMEWVEDEWHDNYIGAPSDGGAWIDNPSSNLYVFVRVFRGGSWRNDPAYCRSAYRDYDSPVTRRNDVGIRVVMDLE